MHAGHFLFERYHLFVPSSVPPLSPPLLRRWSKYLILSFRTWSPSHFPLLAPAAFSTYPCCGLSCCTLHSQDSLLPLCPHTITPAAVTKPPSARSSPSGLVLLLRLTPSPNTLPSLAFLFFNYFPATFYRLQELKHWRANISSVHERQTRARNKRHVLPSAPRLYLHASGGRRSAGVHGLDVAGFAASDHKAPAHGIADDLGGKRTTDQNGGNLVVLELPLARLHPVHNTFHILQAAVSPRRKQIFGSGKHGVGIFMPLYSALEGEFEKKKQKGGAI